MAKILITGATAGIGRVTALRLAAAGHEVFAAGRRKDALESLEAESGKKITGIPLDVTETSSVAAAAARVDEITDGYGLDVLVNNAGYGQGGPLELISDEELRAQYDTNVFGLMAVTRAFVPRMRARGRGRIINVGSVAGSLALPFLGAYASTKHAVQGLSEGLRRELRPFGVDVVVIRPGAIRTTFGRTEQVGLGKYATADSPYRADMKVFMKWHESLHPAAPDPVIVAKAIERAATISRPKPYYLMPSSTVAYVWLQKLLPTAWTDRILARAIGLRR